MKIVQGILVVAASILLLVVLCSWLYDIYQLNSDIKITLGYILMCAVAVLFALCGPKLRGQSKKVLICGGIFFVSFFINFLMSQGMSSSGDGDLRFYFTNAAQMTCRTFEYPNFYCGIFGVTATYPFVLSLFMRIFGVRFVIAAILNNIAVSTVAVEAYLFLKNRLTLRGAIMGALLLAIHPIIMIYSGESNAEIIFGCLMMLSFFAFVRSNKAPKFKKQLKWAVISALFCGASLLFRPMGVIMVVAILLYAVFFSNYNFSKKAAVCLVFISIFTSCGAINNGIIKKITGFSPSISAYGWNLYVGASETGKWNVEDCSEFFDVVLPKSSTPDEVHTYFAIKAFSRYKSLGFASIQKSIDKLKMWFPYWYVTNLTQAQTQRFIPLHEASCTVITITSAVDITLMISSLLGLVILFKKTLVKTHKFNCDTVLVLAFYVCGSLITLMLLEAAERYTMSYRIVFCVLTALLASDVYNGIRKKFILRKY